MVADIRSKMSLYVARLGRSTKKEGRGAILVRDMNIDRLMTYVQQTEEEKLQDRKEYRSKRAKTSSHDVRKRGEGIGVTHLFK